MKKEDLAIALHSLREQLFSDSIFLESEACINQRDFQRCDKFRSSIISWAVSGKGHFDRFSQLQLDVAEQLGLSKIYGTHFNSIWVPHWTSCPTISAADTRAFVSYLQTYQSRVFLEAHHSLISFDSLLSKNLKTDHGSDEFIAEALIGDEDPCIESVEDSLRLIRELANTYCATFHPGEACVIRVSYLDMGSNYQVGVKVDAKAEIGVNLTRFLTQILKFVTNPRAFIQASRVESLRQKVEAFAEIQKRVDAGEISHEAGERFANELFGAAQNLTNHGVFPAVLLKEKVETNTVQEFRSLIKESTFQKALPEPRLELPETTQSSSPKDKGK